MSIQNISPATAYWQSCNKTASLTRELAVANVGVGILLAAANITAAILTSEKVNCIPAHSMKRSYATFIYKNLQCPPGTTDEKISMPHEEILRLYLIPNIVLLGVAILLNAALVYTHDSDNKREVAEAESLCQKIINTTTLDGFMQLNLSYLKARGFITKERAERTEPVLKRYRELNEQIRAFEKKKNTLADPRKGEAASLLKSLSPQEIKQHESNVEMIAQVAAEFAPLLEEIKRNLPDPLGKLSVV